MKANMEKPCNNGLEQKIEVRIDPWDTWSMDYTLAPIILPMLKQLKEAQHGAPCVDPKDCPDELMPEPKEGHGVDNTHFERWNWVMDEMIFAFDSKVNDDWHAQFNFDREGHKACEDRIQKGFELFGKYFQNLWD